MNSVENFPTYYPCIISSQIRQALGSEGFEIDQLRMLGSANDYLTFYNPLYSFVLNGDRIANIHALQFLGISIIIHPHKAHGAPSPRLLRGS